jgi:hypothetical protein
MAGALVFLILAGLVLWVLGYLFIKSVVWVCEPVVQYFAKRDEANPPTETTEPEEESYDMSVTVSSIQGDGSYKEQRMIVDLKNGKIKSDWKDVP